MAAKKGQQTIKIRLLRNLQMPFEDTLKDKDGDGNEIEVKRKQVWGEGSIVIVTLVFGLEMINGNCAVEAKEDEKPIRKDPKHVEEVLPFNSRTGKRYTPEEWEKEMKVGSKAGAPT